MGGVGSGGRRPGAGRPKGSGASQPAAPTARVLAHPSVPAPVVVEVDLDETQAPDALRLDERLAWLELGKFALTRGKTLEDVQAYPFQLLCKNVALERRYSQSVTEAGSSNHRGMIQAIDRELLRFGLVDFGKAAPAKPQTVNPFAQMGS